MFWAKSREIVEGGEAGKEPEGLRRREGKGGARRRRREIGYGRSGANEPTGRSFFGRGVSGCLGQKVLW